MPVLRVGDERTRSAGGRDLGVEEREDRRAAGDRQVADRVGEVVLDVDDDERGCGLVPSCMATYPSLLRRVRRANRLRSGPVALHDDRCVVRPAPATASRVPPRSPAMSSDDFKQQLPDLDPSETRDWIESFDQLLDQEGAERARFVAYKLLKRARQRQVGLPPLTQTRYINTISPEQEPPFPGNEAIERRIRRLVRWNAAAMVLRANNAYPGIGGHLSTYASSASLYEVGFNHFFRGKDDGGGDQVFYQGHAAPGMYARAFLEGRLSEDQLDHFRRETVPGGGLSSYPHPRLMPDFWEFPTVSMSGHLGDLQARFNQPHTGDPDTSLASGPFSTAR
jgi:hypothetical protein